MKQYELYREQCGWCKRWFQSYEENRVFCTDECQAKYFYAKEHGELKKIPKSEKKCQHCGNSCSSKYCGFECSRLALRKAPELQKPRGKGRRGFSFSMANRIAEKNRIFDDDHAEKFVRWGGVRDRI